MASITTGYTFVNNETVTPAKLNSLAGGATLSALVDADISSSAAISDTKLATISTAGKVNGSALVGGSVPQSAFASSVILVPTGAVMPFAMNSAPTGWLAADGTEHLKTGTYASLFAAIGVTYGETNGSGGVGTTHFRVPDLRGYFVRGSGTNSDGTAAGTFGDKQADAFQGHFHSVTHNAARTSGSQGAGGTPALVAAATITIGSPTTDGVNGTPRTAAETRPKNIAMLYCIKS